MAILSSTGRFAAGETCADNDILYGPYATIAAAHAALLIAEQNVIGRTVGIQTGNTIEEYWYQGGTEQANLVKKQSSEVEANPEGEATQTLTKIRIGNTIYTAPAGVGIVSIEKIDTVGNIDRYRISLSDGTYATFNVTNGTNGVDGTNAYIHIKYAATQPTQDSDMHDRFYPPTDKYIGIYSGTSSTSPTTYTSYTWAKFVGENGQDGQDGQDGKNGTNGVDGKSALQIYNETYGTNLDEAQFINVLKQNYPMEYVAYNQTAAEQPIGTGFASIGTLSADATTAGKMYLMPNNGTTPTGTILFVTVQTPNSNPATYQWYSLGALSVPSNVLTEDKIDNDFAGGSDKVAGADEVKGLKEEVDKGKLYIDVVRSANLHNSAPAGSASEPNPENGADWAGHLVQANVGTTVASANYVTTDYIEIEPNTDYKSNTQLRTVAFYREKNYATFINVYPYLENITAGSRITSPNNAKYVKFSYYSTSPIPANVKFGKYADDINVDYSVSYVDKDYYGNEIALKNDNSQIDGSRITDGTITNEKLSNGTITNDKIKYPLPIVLSNNLFDKNTMVNDNHYVGINGSVNSASGWACTSYIEIEPNTDYYFYARVWGRTTGYIWCKEDKSAIDGSTTGNATIAGIHTSPGNAKYIVFNIKSNGVDSTDVMLAKSSTAIPYEEYGVVKLPTSGIKDFSKEVNETVGIVKKLNVTKNGNSLTVSFNNDRVVFNLESNSTNVHSANPVCNISSRTINGVSNPASDDIAPMHILSTTLGANHAQPIQKVTISAHGLTNQDVGTEWIRSSDNRKFYIVRIVDTNNVWVLSENTRNYLDPIRVKLSQDDTLSKDGTSLTAESVDDAQMYPALKNHIVQVYCDDNNLINDGSYSCNKVSIIEGYEIMNPESVLQNLISNVGNSDAPVYNGNSAVRVENVYTFDSSITMTVLTTVVFLEAVRFSDIMTTQLTKAAAKYYVPNSLPIANGIDLRVPTNISWTSSTPLCNITQDKVDNTEYPINRVLQYGDNVGYAIGYLQDIGVAQKINKYTSTYFEIRNNTGKIYPHPVDYAKTLTYQNVGNTYTSLMYVAPFVPEVSGSERLSIYTVKNGNSVYIYVDYIDSILDKVIVDNSLNGKKITVLESSNAELVVMDNNSNDEISNNIYNNGFYVNANYVSGETCYIVLKIE